MRKGMKSLLVFLMMLSLVKVPVRAEVRTMVQPEVVKVQVDTNKGKGYLEGTAVLTVTAVEEQLQQAVVQEVKKVKLNGYTAVLVSYTSEVMTENEDGTNTYSVTALVKTAGAWKKDSTGWWYRNPDGSYPKNCWQFIDNEWYHFNSAGYMQTGWFKSGSTWYYLASSGKMLTGMQKIGGKTYYLKDSGAMATGWVKLNGIWYYFNSSGAMVTGWQSIGGVWYYFNTAGEMQTGWLKSGSWYYLKSSGAMATGWQKIDGEWYYFQSSGAMKTGWLQQGSTWYYLQSNGVMATGSLNINGTVYAFDETSGAMMDENYYIRKVQKYVGLEGSCTYIAWLGSYEITGMHGYLAKGYVEQIAFEDIRPGDVLTFSGAHEMCYLGNGKVLAGNVSYLGAPPKSLIMNIKDSSHYGKLPIYCYRPIKDAAGRWETSGWNEWPYDMFIPEGQDYTYEY